MLKIVLILLLLSFNSFAYPQICKGMEQDFKSELDKFDYKKLKGMTIFAGSSSMRMWSKQEDYFSELYKRDGKQNFYNRGFGGSQVCHLLIHIEKLFLGEVENQNPKRIVLYSGDNDLGSGKSPQVVFDLYKTLFRGLRARGYKNPIYVFSVKPSPARANLKDKIFALNNLLKEYLEKDNSIVFVDTSGIYINDDGSYRLDMYLSDKLHLTQKTYRIWAQKLSSAWVK